MHPSHQLQQSNCRPHMPNISGEGRSQNPHIYNALSVIRCHKRVGSELPVICVATICLPVCVGEPQRVAQESRSSLYEHAVQQNKIYRYVTSKYLQSVILSVLKRRIKHILHAHRNSLRPVFHYDLEQSYCALSWTFFFDQISKFST
jgi:hypothetical protein